MNATRRETRGERPAARQGASAQKTSRSAMLRSWLLHHRRMAGESLQRLLARPASTAMTWLVIGIALALPGSFQLLLDNLRSLAADWDGGAQLSAFLERDLAPERLQQLLVDLEARSDLEDVEVITPEAALAELVESGGLDLALGGIERNPLPTVLVLRPRHADDLSAVTAALQHEVLALPEVERVVLDLEWLQRLQEMMRVGDRIALALAVLLSAGVVLVLGNTIRLEIENRREEIQVVKLVGGTDAFVRRPFLYTGVWYGLGGGLVAVVVIVGVSLWVGEPLARLLALYGADVSPAGPGPALVSTIALGSACLGLFGAWFAVGRHLDHLQPT